jgi:hypothetical protein
MEMLEAVEREVQFAENRWQRLAECSLRLTEVILGTRRSERAPREQTPHVIELSHLKPSAERRILLADIR